MPSKRPQIVVGEIYHIVIKAVEGLKLFRDEKDYFRMIHDLFEFNDERAVSSNFRMSQKSKLAGNLMNKKRNMLVEILAFCLMSNHVHLLVRQFKDGGISKFMRKIGAGYSAYHNRKYRRAGHVFQGRYKIVHIANDNQLKAVFVYIHTNPVAILFPGWKKNGIKTKNLERVIVFLEKEYRWSSYPDYLGNKNFPSISVREWLINEMGGVKEFKRFVNDWLQTKKELAEMGNIIIE